MRRLLALIVALGLLLVASLPAGSNAVAAPDRPAAGSSVYLPVVSSGRAPRRVNAPFFNVPDVIESKFAEMAIFWLGRVSPAENYADVRVAYNSADLFVYVALFDRRLWYDPTPSALDLVNWDALTVYLNTTGPSGAAPGSSAYRFDAQLNDWEGSRAGWQAAYRGNGSGWGASGVPFTTDAGYRWESDTEGGVNNNENNRGWVISYRVPFSSLGLSNPPATGAEWGLALSVHDRDDAGGAPIADKTWPETMNANSPSTWGTVHFGLPGYTPPAASSRQTTTIRHGLNGAVVPDAGVGGTLGNLCPGDSDYVWNVWGNANFAGDTGVNIQNQSDIADWPCFAKYYVTFPLNAIPPGKAIVSATLTLHHWGNSGSLDVAGPSYVHVLTVADDWNESTLTWNNAPLATENVGQAWAPVVAACDWPCAPRVWDVSRAVALAYAERKPLRLALYSSDSAYHSGKFFTTSDAGDWNEKGRPALVVTWGNP